MRAAKIHIRLSNPIQHLTIEGIPNSGKIVLVTEPARDGESQLLRALISWLRCPPESDLKMNSGEFPRRKLSRSGKVLPTNFVEVEYFGERRVGNTWHARVTAGRSGPVWEWHRTGFRPDTELVAMRNWLGDSTPSNWSAYRRLIAAMRRSIRSVFPELILHHIQGPDSPGAKRIFFFQVGAELAHNYDSISIVERLVFDLFRDLCLISHKFRDSLYLIDARGVQLPDSIQAAMLYEIYRIVADSGQVWISTDSTGMTMAAREIVRARPGSVCVLDLRGAEYSRPCRQKCVRPTEFSW